MPWLDLQQGVLEEFVESCAWDTRDLDQAGLTEADWRTGLSFSPNVGVNKKLEWQRGRRQFAGYRRMERWQEYDRAWMRKLSPEEQELYLAHIGPERAKRVQRHWIGNPRGVR